MSESCQSFFLFFFVQYDDTFVKGDGARRPQIIRLTVNILKECLRQTLLKQRENNITFLHHRRKYNTYLYTSLIVTLYSVVTFEILALRLRRHTAGERERTINELFFVDEICESDVNENLLHTVKQQLCVEMFFLQKRLH